jgi:8-oxo-dGTP pyrophosphatase MutT (NUDIX family)
VSPPEQGDRRAGFHKAGEEELLAGRVFRVARARYLDPEGHPFERFLVHHPGAVAIVAVDGERRVHLVRQYRASVEQAVLELPAGTCDVDGEARVDTARRELAEEVGLQARDWQALATVCNSPGYSDQRTTIFLATGLSPCPTARGGVEEQWMTVETLPLDGATEDVGAEAVVDETTLLGLVLARSALGPP